MKNLAKTLLKTAAAALLACTLSGARCTAPEHPRSPGTLDDVVEGVYRIKSRNEYKGVDGGSLIKYKYGTATAFKRDDGKTYLLTAKHVTRGDISTNKEGKEYRLQYVEMEINHDGWVFPSSAVVEKYLGGDVA
ncbi:hypothetical protein ACFL96_19985, partial [Thermoproteota archaeon]